MLAKCHGALLLFGYQLLLSGAVSEITPTIHSTKSISQCGQYDATQDEDLMTALQQIRQHLPMKQIDNTSCQSIHSSNPSAPSGYYNIIATNVSGVQVYCDMEGTHCGGEGGWTRVTYINMTQAGTTCPQGLEQMSFSGSPYCGRFSSGSGCVSALLNTIPPATSRCVDEWLDTRRMVLMHFDHIFKLVPTLTKFTLMDCLYFMAVLVTILYGHMQLVIMRILLVLTLVHVTTEAHSRFLPTLAVTTTVSLGIMVATVLMLCFLMSCGMDSSVMVERVPVAHTPTCHGP